MNKKEKKKTNKKIVSKKTKILKIVILILVLIILTGVTIYLFPVIKNLATPEGQADFKQKITTAGPLGIFILFGLEVAQIFLFIIPGEPIEILSGMCFGGLWGTVFLLVSVFIITTAIVFLVSKLGKNFVYELAGEEKIKKIENNKFFQDEKKITLIMFILFFIPGTPKDLLVYIGALLPIKPWKFILISTFARFPSIISSTLAGDNIINGDWKTGLLLYGGVFVISVVIILIFNKFDKNKLTKKALKEIK